MYNLIARNIFTIFSTKIHENIYLKYIKIHKNKIIIMQVAPFLPNTVAIEVAILNKIFLNKIYFFNLMFKTISSLNGATCRGPPPPPPIPVGGPLFFEYKLHFVLLITFIQFFYVII